MSKLKNIKRDMVKIARRCSERNAQTGNGGNISIRLGENRMVIMASKSAFADCQEVNFVVADFEGNLLEGKTPPSRESVMHGAIYRKFSQINAIVHCHSPYATAWASTMLPLPFSTYHAEKKLLANLKVFDTLSYAVPKDKVAEVLSAYEENEELKGFLLRKHGSFAFGENIFEANYNSELIEETAKIQILGEIINKQVSLIAAALK